MTDKVLALVEGAQHDFQRIAQQNQTRLVWAEESHYALQRLYGSEYLMKCDPATIQDAIINVAAVGLSLNPVLQQAALVPRKVGGELTCCLDVMYQGLIHLACEGGKIISVRADVVRERDREDGNFRYSSGTSPAVIHNPDPFMSAKDRGKIIGAYCVAEIAGSAYPHVTFMPWDQIEAIRNKSEYYAAKKKGPWVEHEEEMCKKTVTKRAQKYWPKGNSRLAVAIQLANVADGYPDRKPDDEAIDVESVEVISPEDAAELRKMAREAKLKVEKIYDAYSIDKMENLPQSKLKECRERINRAKLTKRLKDAVEGEVIAAIDWGITLRELKQLGDEMQTLATLVANYD